MEQAQKNAIGVAIKVTIEEDGSAVDVSAATTKELVFKKPNGTTVTKTAAFVNTGSDGKIKYVTESGFLDLVGYWQVQGNVAFSGGFSGRSDIQKFQVLGNL